MRFVGLTLALLASSLGARAESLEDRVAALEARVKTLEAALQVQAAAGHPAAAATAIDGSYQAVLPDKTVFTAEFSKGRVFAAAIKEGTKGATKVGTYEIVGQRVLVTTDGKTVSIVIDGDHLRTEDSDHIDFVKIK